MPLLPGKANVGRNIATEQKAGKSRRQNIAIALNVARKGKADGGGVLADVQANPRGWQDQPPVAPVDTRPAWMSPAASRARAIDAITARDAIGQPDVDIPIGIARGATDLGLGLSGISPAMEAGETLGRAKTGADVATGAGEMALAATPYLGPLGRGLAAAMRYAPRTTAGVLSTLAATTFPAAAGGNEDDPLRGLYADRARLTQELQQATDDMRAEVRTGKGPNYQAALSRLQQAQARKDALDQMIARKEQENSPEHAIQVKKLQDAAAAEKAKAASETPLREQYPYLPAALTGAGLALSAGLPFALRAKGNMGSFLPGSFASRLGEATDAARTAIGEQAAPEALRRAKEIDDLLASNTGLYGNMKDGAKAGAAALTGGALTAEANMIPDQYDMNNLPEGPLKKAAHDRVYSPSSYMDRGFVGALTGLSGYKAGDMFPKASPNISGARSVSESIRSPDWGDELAIARRNIDPGAGGGAAPALPQGLPPSSIDRSATELTPIDTKTGASGATDLLGPATPAAGALPSPQTAPAIGKALEIAKSPAPEPASSAAPADMNDLVTEKASKILKEFRGVRQWQEGDKVVHKIAPGSPDAGQYTKAPKLGGRKTNTPSTPSNDEGPPIGDNGIPVKPPKEIDPSGPGNFAYGGAAVDLARKYAKGGVVVGPIVGNTGGRADARDADVPANSFVIPADIVAGRGQGNTEAGQHFFDRLEQHVMNRTGGRTMPPMAAGGVTGGSAVPIRIADGERVVPPHVVQAFGDGDMDHGHRVLTALVNQFRNEDINTLKNLPPPSR